MRIVLAPDGFKGSLAAPEVCAALAAGLREADPAVEVVSVPLADGGEGTVEVLVAATGGELVTATVSGPLGTPVRAHWGLLGEGRTAVLEMAQASGLPLLAPAERDPLRTSTAGTGELIRAALERGCREILIGIGGSATNDAGLGMAHALGARAYDESGAELTWPTGGDLARLARLDLGGLDPRLAEARVRVACDVNNPLYGPQGAARVFAPQKGATPAAVERLEAGLRRFAAVVRRDLAREVAELPGAGAAGGLGAGLVAFCGATLEPGAGLMVEAVGLREKLRGADLVITGEGRLDEQTRHGKLPATVARVAAEEGVPAVALAGQVACGPEEVAALGLRAALAIGDGPRPLQEALDAEVTRAQLAKTAGQVLRLLQLGGELRGGEQLP